MLAVRHDEIRARKGFSVGLKTYAIFVPGCFAINYFVNIFLVWNLKDLVLKKSTNE